jgi:hypothetical protein
LLCSAPCGSIDLKFGGDLQVLFLLTFFLFSFSSNFPSSLQNSNVFEFISLNIKLGGRDISLRPGHNYSRKPNSSRGPTPQWNPTLHPTHPIHPTYLIHSIHPIHPITQLTLFIPLTTFTPLAPLTPITTFTPFTHLTQLTQFTLFTPLSAFT